MDFQDDFDRSALRDLAKQQQSELQEKKAELEAGREKILESISDLTSQLTTGLNEDVAQVHFFSLYSIARLLEICIKMILGACSNDMES